MVRQNYFSDLYPAKTLDLSAKLFFSCFPYINISSIKLLGKK